MLFCSALDTRGRPGYLLFVLFQQDLPLISFEIDSLSAVVNTTCSYCYTSFFDLTVALICLCSEEGGSFLRIEWGGNFEFCRLDQGLAMLHHEVTARIVVAVSFSYQQTLMILVYRTLTLRVFGSMTTQTSSLFNLPGSWVIWALFSPPAHGFVSDLRQNKFSVNFALLHNSNNPV